jgi:hypothetical protein
LFHFVLYFNPHWVESVGCARGAFPLPFILAGLPGVSLWAHAARGIDFMRNRGTVFHEII